MRPGQNKRMRGRPSNGRRGPNPLTRSYESNGPDVKIRGTAHHIAEKYLQLARDAHTSGDPVAAENYLQHAEHYYRLIAAAQAAQLAAQNGRPPGEGDDDDDDDDDGGVLADRFASPAERQPALAYNAQQPQFAPQPVVNGPAPFAYGEQPRQPFEGDRPPAPQPVERQNFQPRQDRRDGRPERGPRPERTFNNERQEGRREFRPYRDNGAPREIAAPRDVTPQPDAQPAALPAFITSAPRIAALPPESEQPILPTDVLAPVEPELAAAPPPVEPPSEGAPSAGEDGTRLARTRRRRLRSPYGLYAQGHPDEGQPPATAPTAEETPASE